MTAVLRGLFVALQVAVGGAVLYLSGLGAAALVGERKRRPDELPETPRTTFTIVVPAHDEAPVLGRLLDSLRRMSYPREMYDVLVVADNCADDTAEIARGRGAACCERTDDRRRGKGFALDWALRRLAEEGAGRDAFVILDADSEVEPRFLGYLDREMQAKPGVLQAHYSVMNGSASSFAAVSTLAFALQQYVKPLGRTVLGLSPRLLGNGMCFPGELLERGWGATSISEDLNYCVELLLAGHRTRLVPDALVRAEMPVSAEGARSQRVRWEKGKLLAIREQVPRLLAAALRRRDPVLADAAFDIMLPPFTMLVSLLLSVGALGWAVPMLRPAFSPVAWGTGLLLMIAYVAAGAFLVRLDAVVLARSLAAAPAFLVWKLWIQFLALTGMRDREWVRTPRAERKGSA